MQEAELKCLIVATFFKKILQNKFKYFLALKNKFAFRICLACLLAKPVQGRPFRMKMSPLTAQSNRAVFWSVPHYSE